MIRSLIFAASLALSASSASADEISDMISLAESPAVLVLIYEDTFFDDARHEPFSWDDAARTITNEIPRWWCESLADQLADAGAFAACLEPKS